MLALLLVALASAAWALQVGETVTKSSGTWVLTWQDDFDGPVLNASNWTPANNFTHGLLATAPKKRSLQPCR